MDRFILISSSRSLVLGRRSLMFGESSHGHADIQPGKGEVVVTNPLRRSDRTPEK